MAQACSSANLADLSMYSELVTWQ